MRHLLILSLLLPGLAHADEEKKPRVIVYETKIEILDNIYFESGKALVKPTAFPLLDAVAATLQGNPEITLIEIQGYTDDTEALGIGDQRARAVALYLTNKGVDAKRLQSRGYGA